MRHITASWLLAIACVATLVGSQRVAAQAFLARPIPLSEEMVEDEGFQSNPNTYFKIMANAVNNLGDIVGELVVNPSDPENFAWVIVTDDTSPYPAIDSMVITLLDVDLARANDINDSGIAVGYKYSGADARVWDLNEDPIDITDITNGVEAFAINNNDRVVGQRSFTSGRSPAFLWNRSTGVLTALSAAGSWPDASAYDLTDGTTPTIVGRSSDESANQTCGSNPDDVGDASSWSLNGTWQPSVLDRVVSPHIRAAAKGVNASGNIVGFGRTTDGEDNCIDLALYCDDKDADGEELPFTGGAESEALAINDPASGARQIVGRIIDVESAAIWTWDGDEWIFKNLNDVTRWCELGENGVPLLGSESNMELIVASDINEAGEIAGWGEQTGTIPHDPEDITFTNSVRPFFLIPDTYAGDVDLNGTVDVFDLTRVILMWGGTSPTGHARPCADLSLDGTVNAADLTQVILNWTGSNSLEEEFENAGLSEQDYEDFQNGTYLDDENYRCWLAHYLTSPCGPFCPEGPDCPGSNPF